MIQFRPIRHFAAAARTKGRKLAFAGALHRGDDVPVAGKIPCVADRIMIGEIAADGCCTDDVIEATCRMGDSRNLSRFKDCLKRILPIIFRQVASCPSGLCSVPPSSRSTP